MWKLCWQKQIIVIITHETQYINVNSNNFNYILFYCASVLSYTLTDFYIMAVKNAVSPNVHKKDYLRLKKKIIMYEIIV